MSYLAGREENMTDQRALDAKPEPAAALDSATEKLQQVHGMNVHAYPDTANHAALMDLMGAVAVLLDDAGVLWEDIERQASGAVGTLRDDGHDGLLEVIFTSAVEPQYVEAANTLRQQEQQARWCSDRRLQERKPPPPWPQGDVADADTHEE